MHARYSTNEGDIWNCDGPLVLRAASVSLVFWCTGLRNKLEDLLKKMRAVACI